MNRALLALSLALCSLALLVALPACGGDDNGGGGADTSETDTSEG